MTSLFGLFRLSSMTRATKDTDSRVLDHERTVDLTPYGASILAEEDRPLLGEAIVAGKAGALRAAYVMIWLACAESLKRRFRAAGQRDSAAATIAKAIASRESNHKSVDKFVLDKAKEYGFLSDSEHTELAQIYELRCLYAHPYEKVPSVEQISNAAAAVEANVLSRPLKLRHHFGERLIKALVGDGSYLDDYAPTVRKFAREIVLRLDDQVHAWFLKKYWPLLEKIVDDPAMARFARRGEWFSKEFLTEIGVSSVISHEEWHDLVHQHPKMLMKICSDRPIFERIGERAQTSIVSLILSEATHTPSLLRKLEVLDQDQVLSTRQQSLFRCYIMSIDIDALGATELSVASCFGRVIAALKERNWYVQNPAIWLVESWSPEQIGQLSEAKQGELGRNVLQSAHGGAHARISLSSGYKCQQLASRRHSRCTLGVLRE